MIARRFDTHWLSSLLALLFSLMVLGAAVAQTPVASVNGQPIDIQELSDALADFARQGMPNEKLMEQLAPTLRELILERLAEQALASDKSAQSVALVRRAERGKRRALLDAYVQARFAAPPVSQSEIDQYVKSNPDYFRDRKTFHYSEIAARVPSSTSVKTLADELNAVAASRNPRPQRIEVLLDWLRANKIGFNHAKQWRGGEQMPTQLFERLKRLDSQPNKADLVEQDGFYHLVVLYDSFSDPVNPEHAASAIVQQVLGREARERAIKEIGDALIAQGKVEIYEKNLQAALARPLAPAQQIAQATPRQKAIWATQVALLLLAPFAGWAFFRRDAVAAGLTMRDSHGRHFSHSREARVFVLCAFVVFILACAGYVLYTTRIAAYATEAAISAAAALGVAAVVVLLLWKVPQLKKARDYRWAFIGVVTVAQLITLALAW